ncbi:MAG: (2Fe-2S) ferredoxin domain-containing protein [Thermoplasmatota archaeon]
MIENTPARPYERHVFVCTTGPWCVKAGSTVVRSRLKDAVKAAGLRDVVRVNQSGCLNQCGHGPMVVCYPEGVWYAGVTPEAADEIAARHIVPDAAPVEPYRYHPPHAGNNKLDWIREIERKEKSGD